MPIRNSNGENHGSLVKFHNAIDHNIDAMLWKYLPRNFNDEGRVVGKQLEEWVTKMDDYFNLDLSGLNRVMIMYFNV